MTLDQIRYFYMVAKTGQIGKAAQAEHISQPSLSISIKKLEQELGVPLLEVSGRGIRLSSYGTDFLIYAERILREVEQATRHMQLSGEQYNQTIRFAYTSTVASHFVPELIRNYMLSAKNKPLFYTNEATSEEILKGIRNHEYDFGICSELAEHKGVVQIPVLYQPFILITKAGHPLADASDITLEAVCRESFIAYRSDYPMYRQVERIFAAHGCTPDIVSYSYSEDSITRLVELGLGISIIARTTSTSSASVEVLQPSWLTEGRYLYLTYDADREYGTAAMELMETIKAMEQFTDTWKPM